MTERALWIILTCSALLAACTGGDKPIGPIDGGIADLGRVCAYHDGGDVDYGPFPSDFGIMAPDLMVPPPDLGPPSTTLINGCPSLPACFGSPGEDAGLTYAGFAQPLFAAYCNRCHSASAPDRHGAPSGYNWDDRASINMHLAEMRDVAGVSNFMPFDRPTDLSCDQRRALVTWIDVGAP